MLILERPCALFMEKHCYFEIYMHTKYVEDSFSSEMVSIKSVVPAPIFCGIGIEPRGHSTTDILNPLLNLIFETGSY